MYWDEVMATAQTAMHIFVQRQTHIARFVYNHEMKSLFFLSTMDEIK